MWRDEAEQQTGSTHWSCRSGERHARRERRTQVRLWRGDGGRRKSNRLTQIVVDSLQSCAAFSQNIHLKHRLGFHLHGEGGDGMVIDAFSHVVIQTFSQLLNITAEILQALFISGLPEIDR